MGKRKIAYAFSTSVIVLGFVLMYLQGGPNLGVDFTRRPRLRGGLQQANGGLRRARSPWQPGLQERRPAK
ncbi:MAG: hypothetical protein WKG07_16450 [Hymenobacter sp.]